MRYYTGIKHAQILFSIIIRVSTAVQNIVFKPTQRYNIIYIYYLVIYLPMHLILTGVLRFLLCAYYIQCELKLDQNICSHHEYYLLLQQSLNIGYLYNLAISYTVILVNEYKLTTFKFILIQLLNINTFQHIF